MLTKATQVQTQGVLDAVFADAARNQNLGAYGNSQTRFAVWAPTAQSLSVKLYDAGKALLGTYPMTEDSASGVWSFTSDRREVGQFYRYAIRGVPPRSGRIEDLEVTDPYSLSLSINSRYSQVVDLDEESLKPEGWEESDTTEAFKAEAPEDIVIYEAHIRDFSLHDQQGRPDHSGKYLAFTDPSRESVAHLQKLKESAHTPSSAPSL